MKKDCFFLIYIILLPLLQGCDKVDGPFSVTIPTSGSNDTAIIRKVLLEDYTGHTCQGCPNAHQEAQQLKGVYQDSLIVITVHAGGFADTTQSPFTYNFKTAEGNTFFQNFIPSTQPFPTGTVNRKKSGNLYVVDFPNWGSAIGALLNKPPDAKIKIIASWDSVTRIISATFRSTFLNNLNGDIALSVLYTEDSIVNWQKFPFPTGNVQNYLHRHVLRGSLNGAWGNVIANNPVQGNEIITDLYSLPIASDIVAGHVSIVAVLFDYATKEVIQAEEVKLLP